ncbi:metallophosphoesterase [Calditrichota bacterium]
MSLFPQFLLADPFSFSVTADMRNYAGNSPTYDTYQYFRGACEAIAAKGAGAFMISPGDIDPPDQVEWTIKTYIGSNYLWYPVVGNHEAETPSDMTWLRNYNLNGNTLPNIVNIGPTGCEETTYSFDYENAHFVVINEYYDGVSDVGTDGDVDDDLYDWLVADLTATTKQYIFVFGHEPAYPQPDEDNSRLRHEFDSLNQHETNRNRFWSLLSTKGVIAYFCGHTHNYSSYYYNGVWQVDAGHARGAGDQGAPSTFIIVNVNGNDVSMTTYRGVHPDYDYNSITYDVSLPIELTSFTAYGGDHKVSLRWITESEVDNLGFYLYRSTEKNDGYEQISNLIDGAGNSSARNEYIYVDNTVSNGQIYWYKLVSVELNGTRTEHPVISAMPHESSTEISIVDGLETPKKFDLKHNYPNPFNPETTIGFDVLESDNGLVNIELSVYDLLGRKVKTLINEPLGPNLYTVKWNGTNDYGKLVPSSVYVYMLKSGIFFKSNKMILVR